MNDNPKVSIILATYNGSKYIRRAIQSVLAQTFCNYELIIIDDSPDDATSQVIEELVNENRIIYLKNVKRLGRCASVNMGMHKAKGSYIARIDDDDVWIDAAKLEKQVEFLDANVEYLLVGTGIVVGDENGMELSRRLLPQSDTGIREEMLKRNCFAQSSVVFRKAVALEFGGYRHEVFPYTYSEDYELWLKLGTAGKLTNFPAYSTFFTARNRGLSIPMKYLVIAGIRDMILISKYRDKYPHYWQAVKLRCPQIISALLNIISEVPPFVQLKRFLKSKCPGFWRVITFNRSNKTT